MGLFDTLMGNASEVDSADVAEELAPMLGQNEQIARAFKEVRDLYIFTNKRLILVDKQGLTGRKREYLSIPYKSITQFTLETAGHFDDDAELKLWVSGQHEPIEKDLNKATVSGISQTLATYLPG